ncbi:MAG: hypothetical protein H7Y04_14545, partial [Verrucomicrobia bacterium]|nr:hypothetical protein [Cytophagales bacterium]
MKKITAILLLTILLYNMVGYQFYIAWQQFKLKKELTRQIDKNLIADDNLLVFKVAISFYHQPDRKHFERVEGEFEAEGQFYEMVKQKLENDTMYIYCLKNEQKAQLMADLSKHTTSHFIDVKGKSSDEKGAYVKSLLKEYLPFQENFFNFSFSEIKIK